MGMFDYIRCDYPLPDGWQPPGLLQTKDFDCDMVCHVITADGDLVLETIEYSYEVPQSERPYPDATGLMKWAGSICSVKSCRKVQFNGWLNFYGHDAGRIWREYNAKFTDGKIVEIVAVRD
jgi:hypothetical protein